MHFKLKGISIVILVLFCVSCGRTAQPNLVNGKYYMSGDSSCVQGRQLSDDRIMCVNSEGEDTGWRQAMTDQELQMWQMQRMYQQIENQNALNQFNNAAENYNRSSQATLNSIMSMPAPQVTPIPSYGNNNITCINTGIVTNCR